MHMLTQFQIFDSTCITLPVNELSARRNELLLGETLTKDNSGDEKTQLPITYLQNYKRTRSRTTDTEIIPSQLYLKQSQLYLILSHRTYEDQKTHNTVLRLGHV